MWQFPCYSLQGRKSSCLQSTNLSPTLARGRRCCSKERGQSGLGDGWQIPGGHRLQQAIWASGDALCLEGPELASHWDDGRLALHPCASLWRGQLHSLPLWQGRDHCLWIWGNWKSSNCTLFLISSFLRSPKTVPTCSFCRRTNAPGFHSTLSIIKIGQKYNSQLWFWSLTTLQPVPRPRLHPAQECTQC